MITRGTATANGGRFRSALRASRLSLAVFLLAATFGARDAAAATFTSISSGNWSNASIWSPAGVPAPGDNVTVASGHTVLVDTTVNLTSLTVNGSVDTSSFGVTVSSALAMGGGSITGISDVIISGNATLSGSGSIAPSIQFLSGFTSTIASGATIALSGEIQADGTVTNNGTVTILDTTNSIKGNGSFVQGSSGFVSVRGPISVTTFNATATGNTVEYSSSTAQNVRGTTYYDLKFSNAGTKTATGTMTVTHNLSVTAGIFSDGGFQITGNAVGTLQLGASTTLQVNATNFPTFASYVYDPASTVNYGASAAQTVAAGAGPYPTLILSASGNSTKTANGAITAASLEINQGTGFVTFATAGQNVTVTGTFIGNGALDQTGGGSFSVAGAVSWTGSYTPDTGKFLYTGISQTVRSLTYYDLGLSGAGPYAAGGSLTATHGFSSGGSSPTLNLGLFPLSIGGGGTGDFSGTGTINGTSSVSMSGSGNLSGILIINNPVSISGTRTIQSGAGITFNGAVSLATSTTVTNAATVTLASLAGTDATSIWKNTGSMSITGTLFPGAGTLDAATSGNTVNYSGTVLQTVYVTTYDNLSFTSTGSKSMTGVTAINGDFTIAGGSAVTIGQALTIGRNLSVTTSGAVAMGAFTHSIGGNLSVTGTAPVFTGSTISFNGSVNPQVITCIGCSLTNVAFSGSSSKTIGSSFNVLGNFTISSGATLSGGTLGYAISVAGNWSNGGTFSAGNSTITLAGATRTVSASSFYNLTISGSITALGALSVGNDLTISGGGSLSGGSFVHSVTHDFTQTGTYSAGSSTIVFNGSTTSTFNGTYNLVTILKGGFTATVSGTATVNNLTITSGTLMLGASSLTVSGGLTNNGSVNMGTGSLTIGGDVSNNGPFGSTSGSLFLNGSGTQIWSGTNSANPTNLTVSNLNGLSLQSDMSVGGTLTIGSGNIDVLAGKTLFVTGTISHLTGWIIGKLELAFSGPATKTFPVGTASGYTPVDVTVTSGSGSLSVIDTDGMQPNLTGFAILNRYWSIGNNGIGQADFTFHFLAADIWGTETLFDVGRYSGGAWGRFTPTSRDTTNHTISLSGVTGIGGDWTAAEPASLGLVSLTSVHPATAHVFGGSTIYIEGSSLSGATVDFSGTPATVISSNPTRIVVQAPAHVAGAVTVNVTTPSGPASCSGCVTYTGGWSISRDFSPTTNPSVNWTTGSEPSLNGTFTPFTSPGNIGFAEGWSDGTAADVVHNPEPSSITVSSWTLPVDGFGMHPGVGGAYAVVRWTCPSAGVYHVAGTVGDMQASTVDFSIYKGATQLFTTNVTTGFSAPFTFDRFFNLGDTLDFLTGDGGNGRASDAVQLDPQISTAAGADVAVGTTIPSTVPANGSYSYTLQATNGGPDVATNVTLSHTITGATIASIAGTGWTCSNTATTVTCTAASLAASATDSVTVTTIAPASGSVTYTTSVTADNDGNSFNNTANDTTAVNANADLAIGATVAPATGAVGTDFDFTLNLSNAGPASASNVTITTTLPGELSYVSATGATCSGTTNLSCSAGTLAASGSTSVVIRLHGNLAGTPSVVFAVSATETDPATANNSATQAVTISSTSLVVTSANDSGLGTLRAAITAANNPAVCPAPCSITFNLPPATTALTLSSPLPAITASQVTIDATTQPGYSGSPLVTLSGTACTCLKGFDVQGNNATIRGFVIGGFVDGLSLTGSGTKIEANDIGISATNSAVPNVIGIMITSSLNTIGGSTAAQRNVISRNSGTGIHINGGSSNIVRGNYIGVSTGAATVQPNATGIRIEDGSTNSIGGPAPADGNVIGGNTTAGINVQQSVGTTDNNTIQSNHIGTDGVTSLPNATGVRLSSGTRTTISGNEIAHNSQKAVEVLAASTKNVLTANNLHEDGVMGIDLGADGVTADDPGDGDTGANNLQNRPVILDSTLGAGSTLLTHVSVDSSAVASTQSLRVELFKADLTTTEGQQFLGFQCFAGNQLTNAAMSIAAPPVVAGDRLVATATSYSDAACTTVNDGTSEFSPNVTIAACTPPSATITPSGATTFCAGGSVTLSAPSGAGLSYLWSNSATTQSITVTAGGSYSVTVTSPLGCSSTSAATTVTVNAIPTATITASGPTTFCAGGSVTLSAPAILGNTFLWSNGFTTPSITVTASGSYTVTVTRNGCSATSAPTVVTANALPSATITASGPTTFCTGGSVVLSVPFVAGNSYLWSNAATSAAISVNTSGSYSVTVTDGNGCSVTSAPTVVTVNSAPATTITPSGPTTFCAGGSVTLTASTGSSYLWSNSATTQSITVNASGTFSVAVTYPGGCTSTSPNTVVSVTATPALNVTASGPTNFCAGGNVTLTAAPGFSSYLWSNGATTQSTTVNASGSYTVTGTTGSCSVTSAPTSVTVTPAPSATITAPATTTAGTGGYNASVPPLAGAAFVWTISGGAITAGQGTPSITFTAANNASFVSLGVTVTNAGCSTSGTVSIPVTGGSTPPPPPPPSTHADLSILVSGPSSTPISGVVTYTITVTNAGPDPALNVTLGDFIDNGTMTALSGPGWNCFTSPAGGTCTLANFAPGSSTLTATVTAPNAAGAIHNNASIASATNDPNGTNNEASSTTTVVAPGNANCASVPPSLVAPADGATNVASPATFSWSAVAGANRYELWIANAGSSPSLAGSTSSTSLTISLPGGDIAWYVVADFPETSGCSALVSAQRRLNVTGGNCGGHTTASLIAPAPGATLQSPVTFQWSPVPQAIGYRVWFRVDGGAQQDAGTTDGATQLNAQVPAGAIEWSVDALFSGCPATRSQSSRFAVAKNDPCAEHAAANLLLPADHATTSGAQLEFRWSAVPDAVAYRVWAVVNGAAPAVLGTTDATSLKVAIAAGNVEWYVETLFDGCPSIDSAHRTLTIPRSQQCGTAVSQLVSPAADSSTPSPLVNFVWTNVPEATGYELWLGLDGGARILAGTTPGNVTSLVREAAAGQLEWFVRATFDGCTPRDSAHAFFRVAPPSACSDQRPLLTAPLEGAAGVLSPVTFRWTVVPGAITYRVYAGVDGATPTLAGTTSAAVLPNITLPAGRIDWYVEATLAGNCPAVRSSIHHFAVHAPVAGCATPDAPSLVAPSQVSSNVRYAIQWERVAGASSYVVQESATADFNAPSSTPTTADRVEFQHVNASTAPAATYFYRVRALASCNGSQSAYSPVIGVAILPSSSGGANNVAGALPLDSAQLVTYTIPLDAALAGQSFTATPNQPWLTVTPSHGTVPAGGTTLTVVADPNGLPIGTSLGGITLTFGSNDATAGHPAAHAAAPTSTTTVSMSKTAPIAVIPKNTPPPDALIIPAVAHAEGINSKFESDVRISNTAPQVMKYQLTFTPSGDDGIKSGKQTQIEIDPGRTIAIDDVLRSWFSTGDDSASGVLEIRPLTQTATTTSSAARSGVPNIVTFASSRTFNTTANGTFGQYIPAVPFANFIGKAAGSGSALASVLSLQQISQSDAYRTNLGLVEGSGEPASLLVSVFGNTGQKLTEFPVDLKGGQHVQLNSFLAERGIQVDDGRVEVKVTSPGGKVTAYASVLDNRTNDPLLVTPVAMSATGATKYVVAGVADLSNGLANWRTDMRVYNNSADAVDATLTFVSQNGGQAKTVPLSLAPGEVKQLDSVLGTLFGIANDGGALHLATLNTSSLIATARTYNQTSNGTYGQFISAVTPDGAIGAGSRPLQLLQVEESDRYRSNIGIAEVSGQPATVEVTVVPPDSKVAATLQFDLAANQFIQYNALLRSLNMENTYNARISVKVTAGTGRITAYASVIDASTQDPTYVPAQ